MNYCITVTCPHCHAKPNVGCYAPDLIIHKDRYIKTAHGYFHAERVRTADRIYFTDQKIAVREGLRIARHIFAKRGNHSEAHVSEAELAVFLAFAFECGMDAGMGNAAKGIEPPSLDALP